MIKIFGARTHNLQNLTLELPLNQLIVLTGLSGAGKSSLAIDTIGEEGLARFLMGVSPDLMRASAADVEAIEGLPPTLVIAYKGAVRGTVATLTGCDKLLTRLFAYGSVQHSPTTGEPLRRYTPTEIADLLLEKEGRCYLMAPLESLEELAGMATMGFTRALVDGKEWDLSDALPKKGEEILLVVDRLLLKPTIRPRLLESLALALKIGRGVVKTEGATYSTSYLDGQSLLSPLTPADFQRRTPQSLACRIGGRNLPETEALTAHALLSHEWFLPAHCYELLQSLKRRLSTLADLGLGYLTLDRPAATLSAGELQRTQLTAQLANEMTGLLLILDEPTRGLHRQDIAPLLARLQSLKARGNTLLVVEHEPHLIRAADQAIELEGGRLTYQGRPEGLTLEELPPSSPTPPTHFVKVRDATLHNLQGLNVDIPKNRLVAFAGVSGSGKSSLMEVLQPRLAPDPFARVIAVDQEPLGLSPRSLPLTAIGMMAPLRTLLSQTPLAKARGYTAAHFSLAKPGGRCEHCQGKGFLLLEMGPLPPAYAPCPVCEGARYNAQTLQVTWKGHTPADLLNLTASEAFALFSEIPPLADRLVLLTQLGLGYLKLGQPLDTLSSGELQRLKLIGQLAKGAPAPTLYLLDEPSSGLHLRDLEKLLQICHQLLSQGHTIWMVEHHLSMIRSADWVIELGPGAGPAGGKVIFEGTPLQLARAQTPTGALLKP
ncbi:MAG: hypothetical protein AB7F31_02360 [Parachlamydiales bacterium]